MTEAPSLGTGKTLEPLNGRQYCPHLHAAWAGCLNSLHDQRSGLNQKEIKERM